MAKIKIKRDNLRIEVKYPAGGDFERFRITVYRVYWKFIWIEILDKSFEMIDTNTFQVVSNDDFPIYDGKIYIASLEAMVEKCYQRALAIIREEAEEENKKFASYRLAQEAFDSYAKSLKENQSRDSRD